ncbi:MAG: CBS domain-containing protein [Candidatus Bathyarchaeia archaeon]
MSGGGTNAESSDVQHQTLNHFLQTVIISGFIIGFFLILSGLFTSLNAIKPDSTLVFIALIPFIVWLIVSGRITEIAGPGGIGIKLRNEAGKPIPVESEKITIEPDFRVIEKGGLDALYREISDKHPNTLSFVIGKMNYRVNVIWDYLNALEMEPSFRFILFRDSRGKFKGIVKASDVKRILPAEGRPPTTLDSDYGFVRMLETGSILSSPGVVTDYLERTSTNKEALELMEKADTDFVPVVDEQRKFVGVVTQERIVRKILTRLLSA